MVLALFFSVVILLVVVTVLVGCTYCFQAYHGISRDSSAVTLGTLKQSALLKSRSTYSEDAVRMPKCTDPRIDIVTTMMSGYSSDPTLAIHGYDDLPGKNTEMHRLGDTFYFSDAYSFSDTNLSSAESPLSTPRTARTKLLRMHSTGATLFQPRVEQISEGLPLHGDARRHSAEMNSCSTLLNKGKGLGHQKRSVSVPDITQYLEPKIEFDTRFSRKAQALFVENIKVTGLPFNDQSRGYTFVNIDLLPANTSERSTLCKVCSNPNFEERMTFNDVSEAGLHKCTLLVTVSHTSSEGKKGSVLGEVLVKVSELDAIEATVTVRKTMQIGRRLRKKSTSTNCLFRDLGNLFILLQYQSPAGRIKVLVRRASNLPASGKLPGQPDHLVIVSLQRNGVEIAKKETKPQKGDCPVWNEPFLFDIPEEDISQYSLEFLVMRGRIYTKDSVLGHVVIGPDSTKLGTGHWQETTVPHGLEVAKWHAILPVFKY